MWAETLKDCLIRKMSTIGCGSTSASASRGRGEFIPTSMLRVGSARPEKEFASTPKTISE
jgi:hypothetical protein